MARQAPRVDSVGERRIVYVEDTRLHILMRYLSNVLPDRIAYFTTAGVVRFTAQLEQRKLVGSRVAEQAIDVIHPREAEVDHFAGVKRSGGRMLIPNHACRHASDSRAIRNIVDDHGIRTDACMVAYPDRPQNLGARTDVDMTADSGHATVVGADGDLLEQQAIRADLGVWMDDEAIRMRQQQTASQLAIQRNVGASHHAPASVPQYRANPRQCPPEAARRVVTLIGANTGQQSSRWRPFKPPLALPRPIRVIRRYIAACCHLVATVCGAGPSWHIRNQSSGSRAND